MDPKPSSSLLIVHREAEPTPRRDAAPVGVLAVDGEGVRERIDWIVVEEPLEIRAQGPDQEPISLAVTMRTPGDDRELAVGFLYTEGLVFSPSDVSSVRAATSNSAGEFCNVVQIVLASPFDYAKLRRNFLATSSCGICGKASLDQIAVRCSPVQPGPVIGRSIIVGLPGAMRAAQAIFNRTGGLHAAGMFDAGGRLLALREDVGRHNAVDKLVGRAFLDGEVPLNGRILLVSGRTSFEILQKAAVASVPIVCAVSAPSSLAVSLADRLGITLVGFLTGSSFNIYTHAERIDLSR